jgi:hypothetical protein
LGALTATWQSLRRGRPGSRFIDAYDERHKRRGGGRQVGRATVIALGAVLVVAGLAIGWLPGPGGFVGVIGAALWATEWKAMAKLLDRVETWIRGAWDAIRGR